MPRATHVYFTSLFSYRTSRCLQTDIPILNTTGNVYVQRNTETRSHNHFCHRTAIIIIYYERETVALVIEHAMRMHRIRGRFNK